MLKHRNVLADVAQVEIYFTGYVSEGIEVAVAPLPFYHILALVLNCMMHLSLGSRQVLVTNPRDIPRLVKTLDVQRLHLLRRREHALQRARPQRGVREARLQPGACVRRRRRAAAVGGREAVEGDHRQAAGGRLRTDRDLRGRHGESAEHQGTHGHDGISAAEHGSRDSRRFGQGAADGRDRAGVHPRPAGHGRLLEPSGRDRPGDRQGRILRDGRHRASSRPRAICASSTG